MIVNFLPDREFLDSLSDKMFRKDNKKCRNSAAGKSLQSDHFIGDKLPEGVLSPKLYVDVQDVPAGPWKFDFLCTPIYASDNWSCTLIAHVFEAYMITELDYGLGGHFKGRFVAKNSNMTPKWRKRVWMYTNFSHNYPPISIPFSTEKTPDFAQIGCFLP